MQISCIANKQKYETRLKFVEVLDELKFRTYLRVSE